MARIKDSSILSIRRLVDIVELIDSRTTLRKQGARWVGFCPFNEKCKRSFSVNSGDVGLYHCFGCRKQGDAIQFVQETQRLDFTGAVEWLSEQFQIPLEYEEDECA